MTVSSTVNTIREAGNGVKTAFDFPFAVFADSEIVAYKLDQDDDSGSVAVLNTDYTLDYTPGIEGTGTLTWLVAPASGYDSFIARIVSLTQDNSFPVEEGLSEATITATVDKLTMIAIQLQEQIDRASAVPITSSATDAEDYLADAIAAAESSETAAASSASSASSSASAAAASASSVAEPIRVQARLSTDQTGIATATWTKLVFDTEILDNTNLWAASRFTANGAMTVHVDAKAVLIALADAKYFIIDIYKNGVSVGYYNTVHASVAADLTAAISADIPLVNTDYLEVYVYHNNGSNRDIDGGAGFRTSINIRKVAAS